MWNKANWTVGTVCLLACLAAGCEKEPAVTEQQQKKEGQPAPQQQLGPTRAAAEQAMANGRLNWMIPQGWTADPTPRQMREATLLVEGGKAEVVVTRLGSSFGDFKDNINRWRGQIGLAPLKDLSEVQPRKVTTAVGDAQVVTIEGADKATIVGIVKVGEANWFFRLTGEKAAVLGNAAKLDELLKSLTIN